MKLKYLFLIVLILIALGFFGFSYYKKINTIQKEKEVAVINEITPDIPIIETPKQTSYHLLTLTTTKPKEELINIIGKDNLVSVLVLNRIDQKNIKKGSILVVPDDFSLYIFDIFPKEIPSLSSISKLVFVSKRVQAFGLYEYGKLVRQGPVSTGKKSTPTKSDLYFMNWKGRKVISSFSDEWVLEWSFNIDNFGGVSMHKYDLPGYPASHSCVRLLEEDAKFIYNWASSWNLSKDNNTILSNGTPVVIFGEYNYSKPYPWRGLVEDSKFTNISTDEINKVLGVYIEKILAKESERQNILNTSSVKLL